MVFQFIVCENLSFSNDGFDNSVIKFGADLSSSAHFDSKKQDILISAKGLTQWLDNTTLTAEVEYLIKESLPYNGSLHDNINPHYNETNSCSFVNTVKIYRFKSIGLVDSVCFGVDNMKQDRLNGYMYDFSVDADDIPDIHEYLMRTNNIKECFGLLNKYLLRY